MRFWVDFNGKTTKNESFHVYLRMDDAAPPALAVFPFALAGRIDKTHRKGRIHIVEKFIKIFPHF